MGQSSSGRIVGRLQRSTSQIPPLSWAIWAISRPSRPGASLSESGLSRRGKKARPRAARGRPAEPRRSNAPVAADPKDWVFVAVPALVDVALFRATQEQLQENRSR